MINKSAPDEMNLVCFLIRLMTGDTLVSDIHESETDDESGVIYLHDPMFLRLEVGADTVRCQYAPFFIFATQRVVPLAQHAVLSMVPAADLIVNQYRQAVEEFVKREEELLKIGYNEIGDSDSEKEPEFILPHWVN